MDNLFRNVSFKISRLVTNSYSTSFSLGVKCLDLSVRDAVYSIYGFVRFADEIVDTLHEYDKNKLIIEFGNQYVEAINDGISMNPIINSFQLTVKRYNINQELVQAFFRSMKSDLVKTCFDEVEIKDYIYGSADAVGLMCLRIFVDGNDSEYERLKPFAMSLGSAFQKINFLRDIKKDSKELNRVYFPVLGENMLNDKNKKIIIGNIEEDFKNAKKGIKQLPNNSRLGVYVAYLYYHSLTEKIKRTPAEILMEKRISVNSLNKLLLLIKAYLQVKVFRVI